MAKFFSQSDIDHLSKLKALADCKVNVAPIWDLQYGICLEWVEKYCGKSLKVFKECFFFNAKRGFTQSDQELGLMMRSLGYSPTPEEVTQYYQKYVKDNKIDFAAFLEVMHDHSQKENTMAEVLNAFKAHDREKRGYVQTNEVKNILLNLGEKLNRREVDALFRDGNVSGSQLRYKEFVDTLATPVPDY